ncbi:EcoKI restriction-modification system protein HsdS [Turicibacter sanguinis]|nr:EcoKI restriction-modification system protein HsdS [Turicibacter sanguinis]
MSFSEFRLYKLGDLAEFTQGKQIPIEEQFESCENGMIRFLRIVDYTKKDEPKRYIINPGEKYIVDEEDIIMIRYGSKTAGKVVSGYAGVIANNMFKITVNERLVNKKFLLYLLSNNYVYDMLNASQSSSTMPAITFNLISKLEILLPSLEEQKAIADILSSLDDKIELNNQMNETLEEMAQALFKRWFVDFEFPNEEGQPYKSSGGEMVESELGMIPYNWKLGVLGDLIYVQNGYAFKGKDLMENGEVGIIKIKNISSNTVDIINTQYISEILASKVDTKFKLCGTNLLIAMTGAEVGKIGLVPLNKKELYLNQRVGCIKELVPGGESYAYNYLLRPEAQEMIQAKAVGSAQPNISASGIEELKVVIPSNHILKAFQNICGSLLYNMCQLIEENYLLIELRDTLLPKLMSGEIRVSDLC